MAEQLKNMYNKKYFKTLCEDFAAVYNRFNSEAYLKLIFDKNWEKRELKDRMHHAALSLRKVLPEDYEDAVNIILKVSTRKSAQNYNGFADIFFTDFIESFGLDHYEISINALEILTQYTSAEFAIRPFIIKYPQKTMKKMFEWSRHSNHHVRRLSSEGCRPRLPWGMALTEFIKDPSPILPILENLKNDESEYVRKSVANNLNDISKDHPALVLSIAARWNGTSKEAEWIIKHACRTLLKKGNKEALKLFGFERCENIKLKKFIVAPKVQIGKKLDFSFIFLSESVSPQKLRLEYIIEYLKKSGKYSRKIFKITENYFEPKTEYYFKKSQSFKDMTIRKHTPGKHRISLIINGMEKAAKSFEVF
jgi:3-methyladenine DNA glycosylase AlkC